MTNSVPNSIPEMNLNENYKTNIPKVDPRAEKKKFEKTKKELDKIKDFIIKKYKFTQAVGILPPQAIPKFIEEEEAPEDSKDSVHLVVLMPEEKIKDLPKIKVEIIKELEKSKEKIWLHLMSLPELWEVCFDQKFELSGAISMSYPLYDKGILGSLRVAEIHKSLILQKFDKYVVSYVIGGSLIRGEAVKSSDIDVFVIINDTDVKRMPRRELLERLRGMIYQYVAEASQIAGVQNKLEPQIYLLTDFWDAVKDAHPVMFTFIRDGVPLYDRGTFMPWKSLLRMGKLKPSPEAIDMFMSMGDQVIPRSKKTLLSDIFVNIFWGVTTPAQAILMLNGNPPPNAKKELVRDFKKEFLEKKMIEKKYIDFLEKIVNTWRDYEHEKIKEISGTEIDKLLKQTEDFLKRMKTLREEIEKKYQEKTIDKIYKDVISSLKILLGNKTQAKLIEEFNRKYIKKGKFTPQHLRILKAIISSKEDFKKGKMNIHKVDRARREADILIKELVEFNQRKELITLEKGRMKLKFKDKVMELLQTEKKAFLFDGKIIKQITTKIEDSTMPELEKAMEAQRGKENIQINPKTFELIKKDFGNFEIIL
ncbi:MAG: nucleotidyltransferase domain-containing protein [Nanoarchaeota archaeon]|nr:nucleotidyltransferase domain-containing protein [Nanoarchaeota archaeon]